MVQIGIAVFLRFMRVFDRGRAGLRIHVVRLNWFFYGERVMRPAIFLGILVRPGVWRRVAAIRTTKRR